MVEEALLEQWQEQEDPGQLDVLEDDGVSRHQWFDHSGGAYPQEARVWQV